MARIYIDEDISREVASRLRLKHDTLYVEESDSPAKTDAWHLQQASIELRIVITLNHKDFRFLHRVWTSMRLFGPIHTQHAGILTATRAPEETERWIGALDDVLSGVGQLAGRLLVWHPSSGEWREDDWRPDD